MDRTLASVIIPTFNRKESLLRTLKSLSMQTYPAEWFEVIIVDDGSSAPLDITECSHYPFTTRIVRQANQGEVVARNRGSTLARGDFLVFLDDDITVTPTYLQAIAQGHQSKPNSIIQGNIVPLISENQSSLEKLLSRAIATASHGGTELVEISYTDCLSGILSIDRDGFASIGMMQSLTADGRNCWGGVDLAFRAFQYGYHCYRATGAIAYHHDTSITDLKVYCTRMHKVSKAVHLLYQKYPEIRGQIPMFRDKSSVNWHHDSTQLILRKIARRALSRRPILRLMERSTRAIERWRPGAAILHYLYRWITGSYVYLGYQQGLIEISQAKRA